MSAFEYAERGGLVLKRTCQLASLATDTDIV